MERMGNIIVNQVGSYLSLDENVRTLKRKCETLHSREDDVNTELGIIESSGGKKRRKVVENWLINVQNLRNQVDGIDAALSQGGLLDRVQLASQVDTLSKEVVELLEEGKFPQGLTLNTDHDGVEFQTKPLVGQAFQVNLEKIWRYLLEPEVVTIGIWGMGGVGKTTLVTHINNRARERRDIFSNVFWVTVSQNLDIYKLQDVFAKEIKLSFKNEQDERKRAAMLSRELKKRRCLFILDDVWHHIDLDSVGIPVQVNGCKVIITTRSLDVCRRLVCEKKIKVEPLPEEEAWDLFKKNLGHGMVLAAELSEVASCVARECAGLPLGIVTVASCMREVNDVCEWRAALHELKESKGDGFVEMEDEVFRVLKFSYSRLKDLKLQQSFLYCALYPEDHKFGKEDLIQRLIDEAIIGRMGSRQAQFDRGQAILNKLVNSCLLEEVVISSHWNEDELCVKMHDLLRDMAITMSPQFMVKAGKQIGELPEWSEDVERVSIMNCNIQELTADSSPRSPKLSTLLLSSNFDLRIIQNSFFQHMPALQSLDLTSCRCIQELPNSVSNLKNLIALVLFGCSKLKDVPSLAKLNSLKRLDLHGTHIVKVPDGLEKLVNLTYLDLDAKGLKLCPAGILPQLLLLEFLTFDDGVEIKGEELQTLKRLSTFKGKLMFDDVNGFKSYLMFRQPYKGPNCSYRFVLNDNGKSVSEEYRRLDNLNSVTIHRFNFRHSIRYDNSNRAFWNFRAAGCVDVENLKALLKDVQSLEIDSCYGVQTLCDIQCLNYATNNLKSCRLNSCEGIKCLAASSVSSSCFLRNLENLELSKLFDLEALVELGRGDSAVPSSFAAAVGGAFSCLKVVRLVSCSEIKVLFHPFFLPNLQNLQEIEVKNCYILQEIIGVSEGETSTSIEYALPNLTALSLDTLPQLNSICAETISFPSLCEIRVAKCPQLKRMPLSELPSSFQSISVYPMEWWESAEWDHPNAKDLFLPYLKDFHKAGVRGRRYNVYSIFPIP